MLDEDDRSEGAPALRREGVDQHLDRRVETSVDRHPQEELVAPGEHATADDVARDRAHEEDDRHRRQEAEPRHGATEQLVVHRSEHVVDAAPEDPEESGGEEDRDREEEARDEADLEPVYHGGRRVGVEDNSTPSSPAPYGGWLSDSAVRY